MGCAEAWGCVGMWRWMHRAQGAQGGTKPRAPHVPAIARLAAAAPVLALAQSGFHFVCTFSADTGAGKHHQCQGLGRGDGAVGAFLLPAPQGCVRHIGTHPFTLSTESESPSHLILLIKQ